MLFNFMENEVTITMKAPSEVVAGTEFTVEITIKKSKVDDFSRFQQELPIGLFAKIKDQAGLSGGDFRFSDQKVKLLWYKGGLPTTDEFTIYYTIQVDQTLQGTVMLGGQFAYLLDNNRQTAEILPQAIEIKANENVDPKDIRQIDPVTPKDNYSNDAVACYRKKPYLNDKGEIMVDILVEKGSNNKYGKIQEQIPQGFSASPAEDRTDVIFTFKENNVKFLWLTLPAQSKFVVSYKLKPTGDQSIDSLNIKGTFSYVANDVTIPVDIVQKDDLDLSKVSSQNVTASNNIKTQNNNAGNNTSTNKNNSGSNSSNNNLADNSSKNNNNGTNKNNNNGNKNNSGKNNNTQANNNYSNGNNVITDPETGVKYKVQIGAYRRNLNVSYFTSKMQVAEKVKKELNNGLNKYIVGSHDEYKDAREHRIKIWDSTPIDDAFVTAYNNGTRITVQEALMISQQKWVPN